MSRKIYIWFGLFILLTVSAATKEMSSSEIDYKAEFIVDLIDDVTWPAGKDRSADGSILIGVVGESTLTAKLRELAGQKSAGGSKVTVKTFASTDDLSGCQILFVPTEDKTELAGILRKIKSAPVLTVSDAYYFARYGVMVNFYKEENGGKAEIKFEVNTMTMGFVGIKMDGKLLKLATVI